MEFPDTDEWIAEPMNEIQRQESWATETRCPNVDREERNGLGEGSSNECLFETGLLLRQRAFNRIKTDNKSIQESTLSGKPELILTLSLLRPFANSAKPPCLATARSNPNANEYPVVETE